MTIRPLGRYYQAPLAAPGPLAVGHLYLLPITEKAWRLEINGEARICPVMGWLR